MLKLFTIKVFDGFKPMGWFKIRCFTDKPPKFVRYGNSLYEFTNEGYSKREVYITGLLYTNLTNEEVS